VRLGGEGGRRWIVGGWWAVVAGGLLAGGGSGWVVVGLWCGRLRVVVGGRWCGLLWRGGRGGGGGMEVGVNGGVWWFAECSVILCERSSWWW